MKKSTLKCDKGFLEAVKNHFDKLLANGLAVYCPQAPKMWMASLDVRTGGYPENDVRPEHIPRRHYRAIDAPKGCSLYWDQPSLVAAHFVSNITKNTKYAVAVGAYVEDFLDNCVAENGMFLWGNHYYWDAFQGKTMRFVGAEDPYPVDFETEDGAYHETRPIPPAWEIFWQVSPQKTKKAILTFTSNSLFNRSYGGFNRHADKASGCAFLESGGIIVESLAWLYEKIKDETLLHDASKVIEFSFSHRDKNTGLLENNPTEERWDKFACTTEVGLWAGSVLRASKRAGGRKEWERKASQAVSAYLDYGYDIHEHKYYGQLKVADGSPVLGTDLTKYMYLPGDYSDIWRAFFPAHDYPMPFAESCLELYELTKESKYRLASERWAEIIMDNMPECNGKVIYAEHYGRCIHFLWRCGKLLCNESFKSAANNLAENAIETLYEYDMFKTHSGEHRYDAVDGVGYLLLALTSMSVDKEPDMMGTGW